jgi:hypothetical protein
MLASEGKGSRRKMEIPREKREIIFKNLVPIFG